MSFASARRFWSRQTAPRAAVPPDVRVYAIGDIHGCLDLFSRLIERIDEDQQSRAPMPARIVILGDMIDRGPDSAALTQLLQRAQEDHLAFDILKGNHEALAVAALRGDDKSLSGWLAMGGDATLASWGVPQRVLAGGDLEAIREAALAAVPEEVIAWWDQLPTSLSIGDYIFVHAGVRPGIELTKQVAADLLWIREDFLASRADHGAVVVHGNSPAGQPQERANRIGIDTGAFWTGRLTALGLEGDRRWILTT